MTDTTPKTALKTLKNEIKNHKDTLMELAAKHAKYHKKRDDFRKKLTALEERMKQANQANEGALLRFARGEISETELAHTQHETADLRRQRQNIMAALEIIETDDRALNDQRQITAAALQKTEERAWRLIADIESQSIAGSFARVYAAQLRGVGDYDIYQSIIERISKFSNFRNEDERDKILKSLEKEYLS